MQTDERLNILGIPVDMVDMEEAVRSFDGFLKGESCSIIVTPNSEILERASSNPGLAEIIRKANLVIPDGIGLVYASRFLGKPLKERVTGIDFLSRALALLAERGVSVFLLGGNPETGEQKSVAEEAGENMKKAFPGLTVAGSHHGYFKPEEEEDILAAINTSDAGFLCVALGSPKQEEFMARYKTRLSVKAAIGVGGSLDVWAGRVKRAPWFYQKHGLEWLYRVIREPARFGRLLRLPVFMFKVVVWKIRQGKNKDANV